MKPGDVLPMSTLPLGYRGPADAPCRPAARWRATFRARPRRWRRSRTGPACDVLALEPEPNCLLETAAEAGDFLEQRVLDAKTEAAVTRDLAPASRRLRRPLPPRSGGRGPARCARPTTRGVAVPKIQVSSCLEVRDPAGLDELIDVRGAATSTRPRPQAARGRSTSTRCARGKGVPRRRSAAHALPRPARGDRAGAFGSTQAEVRRVLQALAASPDEAPLLESRPTRGRCSATRSATFAPERIQREGLGRRVLEKRSASADSSYPGPVDDR